MVEPLANDAPDPAGNKPGECKPQGTPPQPGIPGPGGVVLDQFLLLEQLSASRTGLVYKGRHRIMGRTVAVKFLAAEAAASETLTTRFHRTVRILSRLEHRNLVRAFEAGHEGNSHYLVMEYVEGQDLRTILKQRGPLPVEEAVGYVAQAAAGLGYAHDNGVWHRNIKPSNLLVDSQGAVKIVGFGLAHVEAGAVMDENSLQDNLTRQGQVMGTYDFMSPEQAVDSSTADQRSDIYSLGCTLYALLTGRSPYVTKSPVQQVIAHRTLPVPSLRGSRPEAPEALDAVFQKMLAKQPDDRYQSMKELLADLEMSLAAPPSAETTGERIQNLIGLGGGPSLRQSPPAPPPKPAPKRKRARSQPRMIPIIIGGAAAVVVFALAVSYLQDRKPQVAASDTSAKSPKQSAAALSGTATRQSNSDSATPEQLAATAPGGKSNSPLNSLKPDPLATPQSEKSDSPPVSSKSDAAPAETAQNGNTQPPPSAPAAEKTEPKPQPAPKAEPGPKPAAAEHPAPQPQSSVLAVPDKAARERAMKYLNDTFDIQAAKTHAAKVALAKAMIAKSREINDDPAGRYVLLQTGGNLAKEAGDPTVALDAADALASNFGIDAWPMRTKLLQEMTKKVRTAAQTRALTEQALLSRDKALTEHHIESAVSLGETALAAAIQVHDPKLLSRTGLWPARTRTSWNSSTSTRRPRPN